MSGYFAPGDKEADACMCPACRQSSVLDGVVARRSPFPAERILVVSNPDTPPGAFARGPVQCESGVLDPVDARAMREIESGAFDGRRA